MDMSLIQGTVAGLKAASDIAKGFLELKSIADVQTKVIDLQSAILSAQSSALSANAEQSAMIEKIRALKEEITSIKKWEEEKKRYALVNPWSGFVTYALKKESSNSEPPHLICTKCYEDGRKSILNPKKNTSHALLYCPVCKAEMHTRLVVIHTAKYAHEYSSKTHEEIK
ncbi:MAG: hypothetical protein A2511_16395 [Deltaproteobacteria bacterium RIFOXYD12_FULL_50_9]|nr:MAG: hypothetical protein A2511_16395 [Deltaproteobacteria bacterium RIFOXYD12_FULL_50_9]